MPRGSKTCKHCGHVCGPRAFFCTNTACGKPFVVKGVESTEELRVKLQLAKVPVREREDGESVEDEVLLESSDYFVPVKPTYREITNQGPKVHVWESKDGKYRLRWSKEFMGVSIENIHGRPYILLKNGLSPDGQTTLSIVRRFKGMQGVLKTYVKILNGIPIDKPKEDSRIKRKKKMKRILKGLNNE
jgi:hypothetical protein